MCAEIQFYIDHNDVPQVVAAQVKSKFGSLRFYFFIGGDELVRGMTKMAQALSTHICEKCGNLVSLSNMNGIQTACDAHRAQ